MDKQLTEGLAEVRTTWDRLSCCFSIVLSRDANTQTYNNAALDEDNNDEHTSNKISISSSVRINSSSSSHRSDGRGRPSKIEPIPTNGNVSFEMNPIDHDFSAEQKTDQALADLTDSDSKSEKAASPEAPPKQKRKRSWQELFFSWFCGVTSTDGDENDGGQSEEEKRAAIEREEMICSLQQDPRTKLFLHIMLIIIICTAVFLYCFFSLWRYTVPTHTT